MNTAYSVTFVTAQICQALEDGVSQEQIAENLEPLWWAAKAESVAESMNGATERLAFLVKFVKWLATMQEVLRQGGAYIYIGNTTIK